MRSPSHRTIGLCGLVLCLTTGSGLAQDGWTETKCALYAQGWDWVRSTQDFSDVRPAFVAAHQAFVDSGCDQSMEICPVTGGELALVDLLTIISMNEGMASTFVPFSCPKDQ